MKFTDRIRSKRVLVPSALLGIALAVLNFLAYRHAWAMTHFTDHGVRTAPPKRLSLGEKVQVLMTGATIPRPRNRATPESIGVRYERHTFVTADGLRLEAWHVPAAEGRGVVLLFHGYADCKASQLDEARILHDLGWNAFLVDFRGSGGSDGWETTIGFNEARDVGAALAYVRSAIGHGPYVLFGGSMGAASVLKAVAEGARPDALILECPYDRLVTTVAHRFTAMGVPVTPLAQILVFWGGVQGGFDGFRLNPIDYAGAVDVPVLQMHGAKDERVTPDEARAIFGRLRGPKRFVLFEGIGHGAYAKIQPAHWSDAVSRFLATLDPP
jgi:uncharacterized protein